MKVINVTGKIKQGDEHALMRFRRQQVTDGARSRGGRGAGPSRPRAVGAPPHGVGAVPGRWGDRPGRTGEQGCGPGRGPGPLLGAGAKAGAGGQRAWASLATAWARPLAHSWLTRERSVAFG
ncbi:hypothetical protein SSTG_05855 [Streptomyces sp. e14]|nr:hypothetical protein SSTG_05855 [Streptomyces sp. e14]